MKTLIYDIYDLHKNRITKHTKIQVKKHKWELINDKLKKENLYRLSKRMKYNTVIDLRREKPFLYTDSNIKEKIERGKIIDLTRLPGKKTNKKPLRILK